MEKEGKGSSIHKVTHRIRQGFNPLCFMCVWLLGPTQGLLCTWAFRKPIYLHFKVLRLPATLTG